MATHEVRKITIRCFRERECVVLQYEGKVERFEVFEKRAMKSFIIKISPVESEKMKVSIIIEFIPAKGKYITKIQEFFEKPLFAVPLELKFKATVLLCESVEIEIVTP